MVATKTSLRREDEESGWVVKSGKERSREPAGEKERERAKRKRGTTSPEGPNIDLIHN